MRYLIAVLAFLGGSIAWAQPPASIIPVTSNPTGSCFAATPMQFNSVNGTYWGCVASVWTEIAASSALGTVTSVATGCGVTGGPITTTGTISGTGPCWAAGGGTAQAQTATFSPAVTLADGLEVCWKPTAANTTAAPTFSPNGLTAVTIVKSGGAGALVANDIITTKQACVVYNSTGPQWELQNPQSATGTGNAVYATGPTISAPTLTGQAQTATMQDQSANYTIAPQNNAFRVWSGGSYCFTATGLSSGTANSCLWQISAGAVGIQVGANTSDSSGSWKARAYLTDTNCASSAAPAVCGSAAAGSVVVAASATTVTVNTTSVTANSNILLTFDSSLGTKLSVTCNTTVPTVYSVSARVAATSFTITSTAPTTNPACFNYLIIN